jgi:ubiquinone/menaquinone biosynthesis C-methylase UbiE
MTDGDRRGDGRGGELDAHRHRLRVRQVYDEIATHFSKTRAYPWPEVEAFLDGSGADAGGASSVGLDVGCGNGRHAGPLGEVVEQVVALDASRGLLLEARGRSTENGWDASLVQGDAAGLPLAAGSADVALYVATLHHLPDRETRVRSLDELSRVLAADGRAFVSAWSTAHDRFDAPADAETGFDTTVDWTLPGGETVPRFYHIYAQAEFEADLEAAGVRIEESFVSTGNCYAVVRTMR